MFNKGRSERIHFYFIKQRNNHYATRGEEGANQELFLRNQSIEPLQNLSISIGEAIQVVVVS